MNLHTFASCLLCTKIHINWDQLINYYSLFQTSNLRLTVDLSASLLLLSGTPYLFLYVHAILYPHFVNSLKLISFRLELFLLCRCPVKKSPPQISAGGRVCVRKKSPPGDSVHAKILPRRINACIKSPLDVENNTSWCQNFSPQSYHILQWLLWRWFWVLVIAFVILCLIL